MPPTGYDSVEAAFTEAFGLHRAGRLGEAERAYRAILSRHPGHAMAMHNLGMLLIQAGRAQEGLAPLRAAIDAKPFEPLFYFSMTRGLMAADDPLSAARVLKDAEHAGLLDARFEQLGIDVRQAAVGRLRTAAAKMPTDALALAQLGAALVDGGELEEGVALLRKAVAADPNLAEAHESLATALSQHGHIREGFEHYMRRAALVLGSGALAPSEANEPPHKINHDRAQRAHLRAHHPGLHERAFHIADGSRLNRAVDPASIRPGLLDEWRAARPQAVVLDGFLTSPALEKLRAYCAASTVWRKVYAAGYLGAALEDGFASPLLAQIVEEAQELLRPILSGLQFQYVGAFKYDSELSTGTNTHADDSAVNLNIYIAPDEANLDASSGGMELWDAEPVDMAMMRRLNGSEDLAREYIQRSAARRVVIPHRANRCIAFRSTQLHKTDDFRFRSDYESRRINISILFGRFGEAETQR